jgi:hypothetical protein
VTELRPVGQCTNGHRKQLAVKSLVVRPSLTVKHRRSATGMTCHLPTETGFAWLSFNNTVGIDKDLPAMRNDKYGDDGRVGAPDSVALPATMLYPTSGSTDCQWLSGRCV